MDQQTSSFFQNYLSLNMPGISHVPIRIPQIIQPIKQLPPSHLLVKTIEEAYKPVYPREDFLRVLEKEAPRKRRKRKASPHPGGPEEEVNIESSEGEEGDDLDEKGDKFKFWVPRKSELEFGSSVWTTTRPTINEHFEKVQGRLMPGLKPLHYIITKKEIKRRVNGVEELNSSSLQLTLRRPKTKNGGELMRAKLEDVGVECPINRLQKVHQTKILPLCEAEALHLAKDLHKIADKHYPCDDIRDEVIAESLTARDEIKHAVNNEAQDLADCVSALESVFSSFVPPITCIEAVSTDDSKFNREMNQLSCATHGLGVTSNLIWLDQLSKTAVEIALTNP